MTYLVASTGDLAEQHPVLLGALLVSATLMIIPESWLLRPLLRLFGFGPYGPVKGWSMVMFLGCMPDMSMRQVRLLPGPNAFSMVLQSTKEAGSRTCKRRR